MPFIKQLDISHWIQLDNVLILNKKSGQSLGGWNHTFKICFSLVLIHFFLAVIRRQFICNVYWEQLCEVPAKGNRKQAGDEADHAAPDVFFACGRHVCSRHRLQHLGGSCLYPRQWKALKICVPLCVQIVHFWKKNEVKWLNSSYK